MNKILIVILLVLSFEASSSLCVIDQAKVISVFQWDDGSIFVEFNKPSNCSCPFPSRFAFHKNDNEKFFTSAIMTAYVTGKTIYARADDNGCPIHGNTAKLKAFQLK